MLLNYIKNIFTSKCCHEEAKSKNCKYCPDCGKRVVRKWAIIKCKSCGHYRKPQIDIYETVKPEKKYCFFCGSEKWVAHNYYDTNIPDSLKSISLVKVNDFEKQDFGSLTGKTKIWIN